MLLVKTYVAPSAVHGLGLFAAEPIARGACIWRFDPRIDRLYGASEREGAPEPLRSFLAIYAYPERVGSSTYVLDGDNARFMNHSREPNTDCEIDTIATRDIAAGEELLCDYRQFHPDFRLY